MINDLVQEVTIPPAPPSGLYDSDFQAKVIALLAYFNTHAVELTTLIEKMNVFKTEVNGTIPLINDGIPIEDYVGDANKTFLVSLGTALDHAVNLGQLNKKLTSDATGITGAEALGNVVVMTAAAHDALVTPDPDTYFLLVG